MALGIRGANPVWLEADLQGNLFDDTFWLFVLQNTIPYMPAKVYHDPDFNVEWTNPIQFLGNGTLPVDIYFESDVVYRLEFRQHIGAGMPSQSDPLIYEVNNYVAGSGGSTPVDTVALASSNQITNPQFSLVNFASPFALINVTNPDPIEVAPGWFLDVTGTGNATFTQVPLSSPSQNPSNAPYALRLQLSGWNDGSVFLRQRFQQNGMLWANKYVSSTLTARLNGAPQTVSATLDDSNGTLLATVLNANKALVNGSYNEFKDYGQLGATTNPNVPPAAYIDYNLALPNTIDIYITSIQLVVQELPIEPTFEQDSIERQVDHTFHYYKDFILSKPISSYLVGWDFALNPAQEYGATVPASAIGANKSKYVWDQTIVFQSANSGVGVTRPSSGAITLTAAVPTQTALIQYLKAPTCNEILREAICANIAAYSNVPAGVLATISLWYTTDATLPVVTTLTNNSLVLSLDANGKPASFNGNWTEVPRVNGLGSAKLLIAQKGANENFNNYSFSGWDLRGTAAVNTATYIAIVIGTSSMAAANTITVDSVSLMPGSIATRPAYKSLDETLRQCQYYYEKSYNYNVPVLPAPPATLVNMFIAEQAISVSGGNDIVIARSFSLPYKQTKIANPSISFYSVNGAAVSVTAFLRQSGAAINAADVSAANWIVTGIGLDKTSFLANGVVNLVSSPSGTLPEGYIGLQYVLDSRLGIV